MNASPDLLFYLFHFEILVLYFFTKNYICNDYIISCMKPTTTRWTQPDIDYIKRNYHVRSVADIASHLNRDEQSVRSKAYRLGITSNVSQNHSNWTKDEIDLLRLLYPTATWSQLRHDLHRGEMSIRSMARKLGLVRENTNPLYTDEEIQFITENMDTMSVSQIADHLGRPVSSLGIKIQHIRNPPRKTTFGSCARRPWSSNDIETLKSQYPTMPVRILAKTLDRSPQAIIAKAQILGIKAIKHYHRPESHADPVNSPYVDLSEPDKAYIAGIIDGEGHIEFNDRRDSGGKRILLDVGNTCYELLEYLEDKCGGKIYDKKVKPGRKPAWTWRLISPINTRHLLIAIYPYLIIKKQEALAVIQYEHSYSPP